MQSFGRASCPSSGLRDDSHSKTISYSSVTGQPKKLTFWTPSLIKKKKSYGDPEKPWQQKEHSSNGTQKNFQRHVTFQHCFKNNLDFSNSHTHNLKFQQEALDSTIKGNDLGDRVSAQGVLLIIALGARTTPDKSHAAVSRPTDNERTRRCSLG